jgi:hypothetical protein
MSMKRYICSGAHIAIMRERQFMQLSCIGPRQFGPLLSQCRVQ